MNGFKNIRSIIHELRTFLLLWLTQSFSALGSSMTSYALVIWSYQQQGRALVTSMLMVCSYAPYVLLSIFAGALSDRWDKKKTMLICDVAAAVTSVAVLLLFISGRLEIWHLYVINSINGLMNTVQQPASEVAITRILPKKYYQKVGGFKYFAYALQSILTPIIATAILGLWGMIVIIGFDLFTFGAAFLSLAFLIHIPEGHEKDEKNQGILTSAKEGLYYLKENRGILDLILFLSAINLTASIYDAAFPAMMLSRNGGSERAMGAVNATIGITMLLGSIISSAMKKPKSRVRVICNSLLLSMSTENLLLALGRSLPVWCIGGFLGWIAIPLMNANLDAIMRLNIPVDIQGRVYSARNTLQFFTIPLGYFTGGFLVDKVFEPFMYVRSSGSLAVRLVGSGKGSGAALLFLLLAAFGTITCLYFRRDKNIWSLEKGSIQNED